MRTFTAESRVAASRDTVWRHATRPSDLDREFRPFLRMTFPPQLEDLTAVTLGERICRSWILLFGLIPVEYDDLVFIELEPGRRFLERSTMLTQKRWEHERTFEDDGAGTRVVDRLEFESKVPILEPIQALVFRAVFAWRHYRLRRLFGG
ncbi:MAG: hypothetical protein NXI30_17720 [bacterium]|nr:hypothetical protein [bacterium]